MELFWFFEQLWASFSELTWANIFMYLGQWLIIEHLLNMNILLRKKSVTKQTNTKFYIFSISKSHSFPDLILSNSWVIFYMSKYNYSLIIG